MKYNLDNKKQIDEFLDYLKDIRRYSNHTIRNYRIDLFQFIQYLYKSDPKLLILEIEKDSVKEFLFSLHAMKIKILLYCPFQPQESIALDCFYINI